MQNQEKNRLENVLETLRGRKSLAIEGLQGSSPAYFLSRLPGVLSQPMVIVTASHSEAERLVRDMQAYADESLSVELFPAYPSFSGKVLASSDTSSERLSVLYHLLSETGPSIVVSGMEALMQRCIPRQVLAGYAELIQVNESIDLDALIQKLISGGYNRSVVVEDAGDFAVRGGIIDVFSPLYPDPVRIELFGDLVESIRFFSASTQRTLRAGEEAVIIPAKETILSMADMDGWIHRLREQAGRQELPLGEVRQWIERIRNEGIFPGMECLLPLVYPQLDTLIDMISRHTLFVLLEPADLARSAQETVEKALGRHETACRDKRLSLHPSLLLADWEQMQKRILDRWALILQSLSWGKARDIDGMARFEMRSEETGNLRAEMENHKDKETPLLPIASFIQKLLQSGCRSCAVCATTAQADRLRALLRPYGIASQPAKGFGGMDEWRADRLWITIGRISTGFVWQEQSLAVLAEDDIFGKKHHRRKIQGPRIQTRRLVLGELQSGDLIVHPEHGIGQYEGLVRLRLEGATDEFLQLGYRDGDRLYIPVVRMNVVQKYLGIDGMVPALDKLGGKSWEKLKQQVKASVEKMAGELLHLYASRKVVEGFSFSGVDDYFRDFEAGFPYEETPDQLKAIADVIEDMQSPTPMDRLVCGDVGYGKTEIALRASFLAINNGKQVAVLVPTTVLAEQHFATFRERYRKYPVMIESLNRFRTSREQTRILEQLREGKIDIVIGTHRLLQKDVVFRDLGLVVLDEEHRFGVKDKEKLKKLRKTVDVLTLSATPIPRTLHMSLLGIRDISVIATPPEDRQSIETQICEQSDEIIVEAITKELQRGGQVFFVHNNTFSIRSMADHIRKLVPEARVGVGHGQMAEKELETVMSAFMKKELDVLVCTTIIESGLDIATANTMIVNRADKFGLAQLYQLRGRVGRSAQKAYAYLFIPPEVHLGKTALKRLQVLMEHSDIGAGLEIAMSDLKIRGGGTILGASQSGHIAAVGYDMFLKLMEEAMANLKGETILPPLEPDIHIPADAFIPESMVPDIDQRMAIYRQLSRIGRISEISEFKAELIDRFGSLPAEVTNLLLKIMLRVLCIDAGVKRIDLAGQSLLLRFSEAHQKNPFGLIDLITESQGRFSITPDQVMKVQLTRSTLAGMLAETKNILKDIIRRVNQ
ncbi:transcription-repair coupling factor [Desulfatirhabdium butyrativorans]|uniref:transcription-repair coupling factor n=1 Tax=Desulfatirhabdium butyrativorans TaxID=340467 RepID=UPI000559418F|nr:transcription-repair coupling factor [Desulfatirhabdium butyrativorans]